MLKFIIFIALVLIGIFLGFRYIVVPHIVKNHRDFTDFSSVEFRNTPNFYFSPTKDSVFQIPVAILQKKWDAMIAKQPRVTQLSSKDNGMHRVYVQLSAFWHFPDFIDVLFQSEGVNSSSVGLYSRSQFGYSDLGVNKKRVKKWLALLRELVR